MSTPDASHDADRQSRDVLRGPLRLTLSPDVTRGRLHGGWWPRTRDLHTELTDLAAGLPPALGQVVRAVYSPADWDGPPREVATDGDPIKLGVLAGHGDHLVILTTTTRNLTLLVVPADLSEDHARQAMHLAASPENQASAHDILEIPVSTAQGTQPADQWQDQGPSWWAPHPVPPSHRARGTTSLAAAAGRSRGRRRTREPQQQAPITFKEEGGVYTGRSEDGRTWRISEERTGWRLEFRDTGDAVATNAGVHRTAEAAMAEARR